jgi:hypothetical protein
MVEMLIMILFIIAVCWLAIKRYRGLDNLSKLGSNQVKHEINQSSSTEQIRVPCPYCAELILPAAKKCRYCQSEI